jgi:hypothetical protein
MQRPRARGACDATNRSRSWSQPPYVMHLPQVPLAAGRLISQLLQPLLKQTLPPPKEAPAPRRYASNWRNLRFFSPATGRRSFCFSRGSSSCRRHPRAKLTNPAACSGRSFYSDMRTGSRRKTVRRLRLPTDVERRETGDDWLTVGSFLARLIRMPSCCFFFWRSVRSPCFSRGFVNII